MHFSYMTGCFIFLLKQNGNKLLIKTKCVCVWGGGGGGGGSAHFKRFMNSAQYLLLNSIFCHSEYGFHIPISLRRVILTLQAQPVSLVTNTGQCTKSVN